MITYTTIRKGGDILAMENNDFDTIDEVLSGQFVTIGPKKKMTLKFFGQKEKKIEEVEKTWNGEPVPKIRFVVVDPNNPKKEKWFDVG